MNKTKIKKLEKLLSSPQKITIIPHKNPDGDALGSSLGLMQYLNINLSRLDFLWEIFSKFFLKEKIEISIM